MFGKMKDMMGQFALIQKMMKDENFRAFLQHPKIQAMMKDPEFIEILKAQDTGRMMSHPKFRELGTDPELRQLASRLNLSQI